MDHYIRPKMEKTQIGITLPSKKKRGQIKERAEYLDMNMNQYLNWIINKDLAKDPRTQYDRLHKD